MGWNRIACGFSAAVGAVTALGLCAGPARADKDFAGWGKYTHAELVAETAAVAPGSTATLALKVTLAGKWHTYWVNPGDSGTPMRLEFASGAGVKITRVLWPYPKRFETGPLITFGFERELVVPIEVEFDKALRPGSEARVDVGAEWLVCEDVCIPAQDRLSIRLPVAKLADVRPGPDFALIRRARERVPRRAAGLPAGTGQVNSISTITLGLGAVAEGYDFVDYFPFRASGVTNEAPHVRHAPGRLELTLNRAGVPQADPNRVGVLVLRRADRGPEAIQFGDSGWSYTESATPGAGRDAGGAGFGWMVLWAFLGGLILNLMPCVFPVLSIKLFGLLRLARENPREVRSQNLAYVAGVVTSFVAVALALSALRAAGSLVGWGFQMQSPVFLTALVWTFALLTLNLLGLFEIDFVDAGLGGGLTRLKGRVGSFFTGVLAVVVASPCTAPFMGVALGFGLAQPAGALIAIFASLGFGLASPYVVFAAFPGAVRVLPRPGRWMERVKRAMALPLLATTAWLFWILSEMRGAPTLAVVGAGIVALGVAFGFARGPARAWARLGVVPLLASGLVFVARSAGRSAAHYTARTTAQNEDGWEAFTPERLEALRGKPALVDMTADWCLTCKVNEKLVLSDPEVRASLKSRGLHLLRGDWTERDESITRYLARYDRIGVPFYVLYSAAHPDGSPLAEVLTKKSFLERLERDYPLPSQPTQGNTPHDEP